jgi:signal transduction histidine kinase
MTVQQATKIRLSRSPNQGDWHRILRDNQTTVARSSNSQQQLTGAEASMDKFLIVRLKILHDLDHDFRNPTSSILNLCEALLEGLAGGLNERQTNYTKKIEASALKILRYLEDINSMTDLPAGDNLKDHSTKALPDILQLVIRLLTPQLNKIKRTLCLQDCTQCSLETTKVNMLQASLIHLLYTHLKLSLHSGPVIVSIKLEDGLLSCVVKDAGAEIEAKNEVKNTTDKLPRHCAAHVIPILDEALENAAIVGWVGKQSSTPCEVYFDKRMHLSFRFTTRLRPVS